MHSIHPTSILMNCHLGEHVQVGPFCFLENTTLKDGVVIEGNARLVDSTIGEESQILWGALIRNSHTGSGCVLGCEVKNSYLGNAVKAKHSGTLIGSAKVGDRVNFGGGAKCANYDGVGKGTFVIEDDVFVGCDVILSVKSGAVRTIGQKSKIGANTHLSVDVGPGSLVYQDRASGAVVVRSDYYPLS